MPNSITFLEEQNFSYNSCLEKVKHVQNEQIYSLSVTIHKFLQDTILYKLYKRRANLPHPSVLKYFIFNILCTIKLIKMDTGFGKLMSYVQFLKYNGGSVPF